ncbi:YfbM family protein [Promicromonospora vindobonensis]|uniref:YfbM family protein n=1 Tax=Promicromonospora vindobonensis TaxID=195748 RepID=A0ABW5VPC0_9MICO
MIGEYIRLEPGDFTRALSEPEWVRSMIDELWDAEEEGNEQDLRLIDVDKAWHGLALVLERAGVSAAVVFGDDQVPGADDWGYGPPSSLSPERVAELAAALRSLDGPRAIEAVPAEVFVKEDIYPQGIWNEAGAGQYLAGHLERLTTFFVDAADAGMGIFVWLD